MRPALGVDPGSHGTGLALVDTSTTDPTAPLAAACGPRLLWSHTVRPEGKPDVRGPVQVDPAYLQEVAGRVLDVATEEEGLTVLLEGVVPPNPHVNRRNGKATTNVGAILHTAGVFAVVLHRCVSAGVPIVVLRPQGHGSALLGTYPAALVSPAERRGARWELAPAGSGKLKDARSAYDLTRSTMTTRLPASSRRFGVYAP